MIFIPSTDSTYITATSYLSVTEADDLDLVLDSLMIEVGLLREFINIYGELI